MPWLVSALKAIAPHIGTIISAVTPAFTTRKVRGNSQQLELMQQQIIELQSAADHSDRLIRDLATQLDEALRALQEAEVLSEVRQKRFLIGLALALLGSFAALIISLWR